MGTAFLSYPPLAVLAFIAIAEPVLGKERRHVCFSFEPRALCEIAPKELAYGNDEIPDIMAKKRRSLQSIFVPYSQPASPSSLAASSLDISHYATLARRNTNSPPSDLLDDDPFANLSSPLRQAQFCVAPPKSPEHKSSLAARAQVLASLLSPSSQSITRASSSGIIHARPAHQKPAFAPRPSLPSLHTLSKINLVISKKVRRGRVGATLPFEPWDDHPDSQSSGSTTPSQESVSKLPTPELDTLAAAESYFPGNKITESPLTTSPTQITDDANADFVDFSDEDDCELFAASPDDEDIDVGFDYTGLAYLEPPNDDLLTQPALSRTLSASLSQSSHSRSVSSTSSTSSLGEVCPESRFRDLSPDGSHSDICFPSSSSTESEGDVLHSPPDDFISDAYSWECTPTPPTSMYISDPDVMMFEPGTSVDTITHHDHRSTIMQRDYDWTHEMADSDSWDRRGRDSARRPDFSGWAPGGNGSGRGHDEKGRGCGNYNGGWGGSGDDGRGGDRRGMRSSFSTPSSSDASSESEDDSDGEYGQGSKAVPPRDSDDDVPLAQRIPTALKAQKTLRLKTKEERDQRRRDRAARRARQETLRPAGAAAPAPQLMSSTQEAALHASRSIRRPRTQTVSGPARRMPFAVEDLTQRLQHVQAADLRAEPADVTRSPSPPKAKTLRPMRSFHQPERRRFDDHAVVPLPGAPLVRSSTRARSRARDDTQVSRRVVSEMPADTEQKLYRSTTRSRPRAHEDVPRVHSEMPPGAETKLALLVGTTPEDTIPPLPRHSEDRKLAKGGGRTSSEQPRAMGSTPVPVVKGVVVATAQSYNMVEIGASTNAGDVVDMVEAQERPIRSFELLADVEASWNKDKMVNIFVLKLTNLASLLRRTCSNTSNNECCQAIPSVSPLHSGYVEWEIKRGKWSKRWLTLREHSLFLSKRDNGKDEMFLCSLSNFDAYFVTRLHKAPKAFVFALKSTDNLSLFENTADYLHVFSCNKTDGDRWMERILLARSYVLHQERNILFNPKTTTGLSRAGTRKGTGRPVQQPLVNVGTADVFEPGSLLRK
ncbi:hypothetical protein EDD18DRAFT_1099386 [Armillaria luteobubalina]|uniref:PH domain-containing protein n=1 Tax=Armillaria luteobubalina TaxID=153913 RepID=A0AA39QKU6_9AGAR|nr:hypothetical protein EDD18DRAFT_1099386 [Armillaria luteobubalina]